MIVFSWLMSVGHGVSDPQSHFLGMVKVRRFLVKPGMTVKTGPALMLVTLDQDGSGIETEPRQQTPSDSGMADHAGNDKPTSVES